MKFMRPLAFLASLASVVTLLIVAPETARATTTGAHEIIDDHADPSVVTHQGRYYLMTTLGDRLAIKSSDSVFDLKRSPEHVVMTAGQLAPHTPYTKQIWAPALKQMGDRWYIYYTASDTNDHRRHRMFVLESATNDPLSAYHFKGKIADNGQYAIDGEVMNHNGQNYFVWTGGIAGPGIIRIQRMSSPWATTGPVVDLPVAGHCDGISEGPTFLHSRGRTYLTYSTCNTASANYHLMMDSIADGQDPMNPRSWRQHTETILGRSDANGVYGPGHHAFFASPDGTETWIAYLARSTSQWTAGGRTTRVKKIDFAADGRPVIGTPPRLGTPMAPPSGDRWSTRESGSNQSFVTVNGQVHHVARTPDNRLGHWFRETNGKVVRDVWPGPAITGQPQGATRGSEQHVFARATDGSLQHWTWRPGMATVATDRWASGITSDVSAMVSATGQIHAFARQADGQLGHWWREPNGSLRHDVWGGGRIQGTPTTLVRGGEQHVFARGDDNSLRHWVWYDGIPGGAPRLTTEAVGDVTSDVAAYTAWNEVHAYHRSADGQLRHRWATASWKRDELIPIRVQGKPDAMVQGGEQNVFVRTPEGHLVRRAWSRTKNVWIEDWGTIAGDPSVVGWQSYTVVLGRDGAGALHNWGVVSAGRPGQTDWGGKLA